ncbi:uncharacterized protein FOMMEDRAFT_115954 [Fomitiporia mediterranea MF3/22]|uniref:uncharacterized protein n=1 Tax=Fomitiporia mediterranea (strain MF3/22) TaxID=694068 RepID=UPI0004409509|nr:uncharacterized protein FOMMEDRAFT_115954 [Fomitiporia mediterranea MF3/22]EJD07601.1 hypothetical protein FOMMEDRAFT_115954 [Fomitiporia mediterranea MF3/22]
MPSVDAYDASTTSVEFAWPKGVTPVERIMLSAHGDLQRILSAFFARPVVITPIFVRTSPTLDSEALSPSPESPTTQKRQVHLVCAGRTVCIATSFVTITSARCAELFLKDGYAIGQIFRKMGVQPEFELVEAGVEGRVEETTVLDEKPKLVVENEKRRMWRRYTLKVEGFLADIVEVFPDREMFTRGEEWLAESKLLSVPEDDYFSETTPSLSPTETLVQLDEAYESSVPPPYTEPPKESWSDSSGGLLRFMAVFIAVLLLLNVPKEGDPVGSHVGSTLFNRIARLLDVGMTDDR